MAYINYAPMRIGTEDPWALTELAKAGGPGGAQPPGFGGVPPSRYSLYMPSTLISNSLHARKCLARARTEQPMIITRF